MTQAIILPADCNDCTEETVVKGTRLTRPYVAKRDALGRVAKMEDWEKIARVYGLSDPRDPTEIRYVGSTRKTVKKRLEFHILNTKRKIRHPCGVWIASLLSEGITPIIIELEKTIRRDVEQRESHWISILKPKGKLLNVWENSKGVGHTVPDEVRKRISQTKKSRTYKTFVPVLCVDTGRSFRSLADAASFYGVFATKIREAMKRNGRCGGFKWKVVETL